MQQLILRAKGIYSQPNDLGSSTPEGALSKADDVVIDQDDIVSPRRGFDRLTYGFDTSTDRANKLFFYQDKLISHYATNTLAYYDSSSGWVDYVTALDAPNSTTKMRSSSANENLYVTTDEGIYKLDAYDDDFVLAGTPKALDITASNNASGSAWLLDDYRVAYRLVWGLRDENNNLILGAPSQRESYQNTSGSTAAVDVEVTVPSGITTAHFYQLYRSTAVDNTGDTIEPSDELGLVFEANPSQSEIDAGSLTITDITPDALRGATIYTASSQEGIANANERPPKALDIATYKNHTFYANVTSKQRITITLLGVGGTNGLADGDTIQIDGITYTADDTTSTTGNLTSGSATVASVADTSVVTVGDSVTGTGVAAGTTVTAINAGASTITLSANATASGTGVTLSFSGENITAASFNRETAGSASQDLRDTALSLVRVINQHSSSTVYAYYLSGTEDLPGKILVEDRTIGGNAFAVFVNNSTAWSPNASESFTFADADVSTTNDTITESAHGLSNGTPVTVSNSGGALPTGLSAATTYYVVEAATNTFKLATTPGGTAVDITAASGGGTHTLQYGEASSNDRFKHGIYFSKPNEPEAVPLGNFFFVGSAEDEILRIVPLRDSLFVFKVDGVYRLSGEDANSFRVDLFDETTRLIAVESPAVLNNQIFCYTDQGIAAVTESGVQIRSRAIEEDLIQLQGINKTVLEQDAFGVAYESERKYIFFCPKASADTGPTQAYVFNVFTNAWTRWVLSKDCGGVNPADDKLYLGDSGSAYVLQERKAFDFTDHVDFSLASTISAVDTTTLTLSGTDQINVGDVIYESATVYSTVASVDSGAGTVTTDWDGGFSTGAVTVYSSIPTKIAWTPVTFGNPGVLKQFQEVSLLFKTDFAGEASVVFTSDVSRSEETETLEGTPIGAWGLSGWGEGAFGGGNIRRPFRMWVPRNKQRATQLIVEFQHSVGFTRYLMSGISLVAKTVSERVAY